MTTSISRPRHGAATPLLLALAVIAPLSPPAAGPSTARERAGFFEKVMGSWTGAGTVAVSGGDPERVRCRADYRASGDAQLSLELRCASDSFNLQVTSQMTLEGERIAGSWTETTTGASGPLSGSIGPNRMDAVVGGAGMSARLSLALRGDMQAISLTTQDSMNATAPVSLRRS